MRDIKEIILVILKKRRQLSFKKASFGVVAAGLIFTSATFAAVKTFKQPSIKWAQEKIEVTLFRGTSNFVSASFTSNENLDNAKLVLVPELAKFASVEPADINPYIAGKNNPINIIFSVPQETATGTYDGTLHLKLDKKTIPQTLKVVLSVAEPSVVIIPDDITYPASSDIYKDISGVEFVKNELIVAFKDGVSLDKKKEIISLINGAFLGSIPTLNIYQIRVNVDDQASLSQIIQQLLSSYPEIKTASHDFINYTQAVPDLGKDPKWDNWDENNPAGNNWGQEFIKLPSAWNFATGTKQTKVAVVDGGFDLNHEDLVKNLNQLSSTKNVSSHGTHVAGIIGAAGNNNYGISGAMWNADLLLVGTDMPASNDIFRNILPSILATQQSIGNNARVINLSLGLTNNWPYVNYINEANNLWDILIDYGNTVRNNILFIISAGNSNQNFINTSPASLSLKHNNIISVAAIKQDGTLADFSNYGDVTVAAPGVDIFSTLPGNTYGNISGTSMAAPFASGLAGLIWSRAELLGKTLTAAEVKQLIIDGAVKGGKYAQGPDGKRVPIINAYESLKLLEPQPLLVIDQSQIQHNSTRIWGWNNIKSTSYICQSFIPSASKISGVRVRLARIKNVPSSAIPLWVEITSEACAWQAGQKRIAVNQTTSSTLQQILSLNITDVVDFSFASTTSTIIGKTYYLNLRSMDFSFGDWLKIDYQDSDVYDKGYVYRGLNQGNNTVKDLTNDIFFETYYK